MTASPGLLHGADWRWLGRQRFADMLDRNAADANAVEAGAPSRLCLFEPADTTYALGRRAQTAAGRAEIAATLVACHSRGIAVCDVDRGGLGTLHAPGQIVAFLAVRCPRWQGRALGAELLDGVVRLANDHGVPAQRDLADDVGVWSAEGKIASLGLRICNDVARHGIAFNICLDREHADGLVLCGKPLIRLANMRHTADPTHPDLGAWAHAIARAWRLAPAHQP